MRLTAQVIASAILVSAVLWAMWRLPRPQMGGRGESLLAWGPPLALFSAWMGLLAAIASALLWMVSLPDVWVTVAFLALDPAAIASGVLVLWLHRGRHEPAVAAQRLQAQVGIALGLLAVALGYLFVLTHKAPFTPTGG